jgi:hypothetical protein
MPLEKKNDRFGAKSSTSILLDVGHHAQAELGGEKAGVLALVLLEDVGLHRSADGLQRPGTYVGGLVVGWVTALALAERVQLLVDDGVEEEREHGRGGAVDRHRHRRRRRHKVEAVVERHHVVQRRHRYARRAHLAVDVGARVGVAAVERHGVERRRQARRRVVGRQQLEAPVGAERVALAGEHAGRVLVVALEREDAGGEREPAGKVLAAQEAEQLAVAGVAGHGHPGDLVARQRLAGQRSADLAVADRHRLLVAGVRLRHRRPVAQLLQDAVRDVRARRLEQLADPAGLVTCSLELGGDRLQPLGAGRGPHQPFGLGVVGPHGLGDLGEVAHAAGRHDLTDPTGVAHVHRGERALGDGQPVRAECLAQVLVERCHAVVVERRRGRAEHRHVLRLAAERLAVADQLTTDVAQGVLRATALELVDRHDVGEVEHVDLLQLRRRAELRRHHIQRGVGERDYRRVALADAGRLHHDQVVAGGLDDVDRVLQRLGQLGAAPGRERAEVGAVAVEGVHPDPVAEQRPAAAPPGRVDGDHGDAQLVLLVHAEPSHQLVRQRGLAGAAGAGDPQHGGGARRGRSPDLLEEALGQRLRLGSGDRARHRGPLP